jgi:hypothetical protein
MGDENTDEQTKEEDKSTVFQNARFASKRQDFLELGMAYGEDGN